MILEDFPVCEVLLRTYLSCVQGRRPSCSTEQHTWGAQGPAAELGFQQLFSLPNIKFEFIN